jgi:hypothetical protein
MKLLLLFTLIAILSVGISACSVKATDDASVPGPSQQKTVAGPDLTGSWSADCGMTTFGEYKSFAVVFTTSTVSRKNTTYIDSTCQEIKSSKTEVGTYSFLEANKDGSYTVQYAFPIGNGIRVLPEEKVLLNNGVLYLSDYAIGDAVTRDSMVPMHKASTRIVR